MPSPEAKQRFKFARSARNWGLSALVAATIGGYSLYQRSASAAGLAASLQPVAFIPTTPNAPGTSTSLYQDGEYQGQSFRADHWGNVQVTAIIKDGQLADFKILDYPHSRSTSVRIAQVAIPYLMQEAVQAQSASIDLVTGATPTSRAFIELLQSALEAASITTTATPGTGSSA